MGHGLEAVLKKPLQGTRDCLTTFVLPFARLALRVASLQGDVGQSPGSAAEVIAFLGLVPLKCN